jgi:hypothetical protein
MRDQLRTAERRAEAAAADATRITTEAEAAEREAGELVARSRALAEALRDRPGVADQAASDPGDDLASIGRWATEARAALFVARGRLAAEREAVIRQANELGTAVLGEPLAAQSAALVARRVERAG